MDTTQLVLRAQNGDQQAMTELYYHSYQKAYAVALQMVKNEQDAYDIMQEAYMKALTSLDQLTNPAGFIPWFNTIVANKCRDFLRSRKNVVFFSDMAYDTGEGELEPEFEDKDTSFQPEENVDYDETKRLIAEMLDQLPEDQKMVLLMYYVEDMSIKEIAAALDVSENTVKSRMSYGKKKLKVQVEDLEKKGTKLRVSAVGLIPFLAWMLGEGAKAMPVHEMAPAVKQASLAACRSHAAAAAQAAQQASAQQAFAHQAYQPPMSSASSAAARVGGAAARHTARNIAVTAACVATAAGAVAFAGFGLPAITGHQNPVSSVFSESSQKSNIPPEHASPENVIKAFEKAFKAKDKDAMAELFPPDARKREKANGFGITAWTSVIDVMTMGQAEYEFQMTDLKMNGDTATATVTITILIKGQVYDSHPFPTEFVRQDGMWYIKEFKDN